MRDWHVWMLGVVIGFGMGLVCTLVWGAPAMRAVMTGAVP